MAGWTSLTLDDATLMGVAPGDFQSADFTGVIDSDKVSANMVTAAKRYVKSRLTAAVPQLVSKLGGPEPFLDAVADNVDADLVQNILGYAFLMLYYSDERMSDIGLMEYKRREAGKMFEDVFLAVKNMAMYDPDFIDVLEDSADEGLSGHANPVFIG